jgi:hypothetical protein
VNLKLTKKQLGSRQSVHFNIVLGVSDGATGCRVKAKRHTLSVRVYVCVCVLSDSGSFPSFTHPPLLLSPPSLCLQLKAHANLVAACVEVLPIDQS